MSKNTSTDRLSLPSLPRLHSLKFTLRSRMSSNALSMPSFVNLDLLPKLTILQVHGDVWSGFDSLFTGKSLSISSCVLKGQLLMNARSDVFLNRLSLGLQYLHCYGTHFLGKIKATLPCLRYIGLHRVILPPDLFPLQNDSVETLCIESGEIYSVGHDLGKELSKVLVSALHSLPAVRNLFLRSTMAWVPSASAADVLRRSTLRTIMLDGGIVLDPLDEAESAWYKDLYALTRVGCETVVCGCQCL